MADYREFGVLCRMVALDRAARIAASGAPPAIRKDVYQDAFVKFLRWPPSSFGEARHGAKQARRAMVRHEYQRAHVDIDLIEIGSGFDPTADAALDRAELAAIPPEIVDIARRSYRSGGHAPLRKDRPTPTEKARLRAWRKKHPRVDARPDIAQSVWP
jgi:hypothetical protein